MTILFESQPREFWIVAPSKGAIDRANVLQIFETRSAATVHAKAIAQKNDDHCLIYKATLHGIAIPKEAIVQHFEVSP